MACLSGACVFRACPIRLSTSANFALLIQADLCLNTSALQPGKGFQSCRVRIVQVRSFTRITCGRSGWRAGSSHMTAMCVKAFRNSPRDACLADARPDTLSRARARKPRRGSYQKRMLVSSRLRITGFRSGGTCARRKRNHCHEAVAFSRETYKTKVSCLTLPLTGFILADPKRVHFPDPKQTNLL